MKVVIPGNLRVGGFDYEVRVGGQTNAELEAVGLRGSHSDFLKRIEIRDNVSEIGATFLHEVLHAIDCVYCASQLEENDIKLLGNGLYQVLKDMGIEFNNG